MKKLLALSLILISPVHAETCSTLSYAPTQTSLHMTIDHQMQGRHQYFIFNDTTQAKVYKICWSHSIRWKHSYDILAANGDCENIMVPAHSINPMINKLDILNFDLKYAGANIKSTIITTITGSCSHISSVDKFLWVYP